MNALIAQHAQHIRFRPSTRIHIYRGREWGFTLIEVLAVIVLLGAVSVLTLSGLSRADDQARLQRLASALQQLDRLARIECGTHGSLQLIVDEVDRHFLVRDIDSETALQQEELPDGAVIAMHDRKNNPLEVIDVSRSGRSVDYVVHITLGGHERGWSIAGLTGLIVEEGQRD